MEFLINVFKKLKEGKGDEDSYGVERATGSYHVAPSFHFVSPHSILLFQFPEHLKLLPFSVGGAGGFP